jgi:hypothetical protein
MGFLLFLFFFIFSFSMVAIINYYFKLFSLEDRESFDRQELIDFTKIIPREIASLFEYDGSLQYGIIAFGVSGLFSFLWVLFGGLFGESFYSHDFSTYLFGSALLPIIFHFSHPYLMDALGDQDPDSPLMRILSQGTSIVGGSTITLVSTNLSFYGLFHETYFIFNLINIVSCIGIFLYRIKVIHENIRSNESEEEIDYQNTDLDDEFS